MRDLTDEDTALLTYREHAAKAAVFFHARYRPGGIGLEELTGVGLCGIWQAIRRRPEKCGAVKSGYWVRVAFNECRSFVATDRRTGMWWLRNQGVLKRLGDLSIVGKCVPTFEGDPPPQWTPAKWSSVLKCLTPNARRVVVGMAFGRTIDEVAEEMGAGRNVVASHWIAARSTLRICHPALADEFDQSIPAPQRRLPREVVRPSTAPYHPQESNRDQPSPHWRKRRRKDRPQKLEYYAYSEADIANFRSRVKEGKPDECWLWEGGTQGSYGAFQLESGLYVTTHRLAYELAVEPVPKGKIIRRKPHCTSRLCLNPNHYSSLHGSKGERSKVATSHGNEITRQNSVTERIFYFVCDQGDTSVSRLSRVLMRQPNVIVTAVKSPYFTVSGEQVSLSAEGRLLAKTRGMT